MQELTSYTIKFAEVEKLKSENKEVFEKLEQLQAELESLEVELKTAVKSAKKDVSNDYFNVQFIRKFRKEYNPNTLLSLANPTELVMLNEIVEVIKKVDSVKLKKLLEAELVRPEIAQKAYTEEELSPSVIIKLIK